MEREGHPPVRRKWAMMTDAGGAGRRNGGARPADVKKRGLEQQTNRELMRALPLPRSAESPDTATAA